MNKKTHTQSLFSYCLTLSLLVFLSIPISYADDDRQYMGMGQGHMGYGKMGQMGQMGQGCMGRGHMGYGQMGMGYGFLNNLDLSDAQRTSIRNIHKEMRTQQLALHDKTSEYKDELYSLYKEDQPNAKKVGAVYKKIFDVKQQQIELGITIKNKTYDVLNKEQKKKLKELKSSGMGYGPNKGMHGRGMYNMME